jgi:hypothetical protein
MNSCFRVVSEFSYFTPTAFMSCFILAGGCGLDSTGSRQGPVVGCCECVINLRVLVPRS